jgi:hypothetical protein
MLVFFKERLAYLAVPKTGTTAVERALHRHAAMVLRDPPGLKHTNARGFERKFRGMFERGELPAMQTVAVMREPVSWLGSWYRYRQRPALTGKKNSTAGISFDEFVAGYLSPEQPAFADIGAQSRFLTDENEDLLVNHLFRYEDMGPFLDFLRQMLGLEIELQRVNTSPEAELALSDTLHAELRQKRHLDFQIYEALLDGPLSIS